METKEGNYYTEYYRTRNQVRKLTRRIQKEFEMKLATRAKTDPKSSMEIYELQNQESGRCFRREHRP